MKFAVGTKNKAKLACVHDALSRIKFVDETFDSSSSSPSTSSSSATAAASSSSSSQMQTQEPSFTYDGDGGECDGHDIPQVIGVSVDSGVSAQPMTAAEGRKGALNRALRALELVGDSADFGIGMEGTLEIVEAPDNAPNAQTVFECGMMAVVHRASGKVGWASTARMMLDDSILEEIKKGKELAEIVDQMTGESDIRSAGGFMSVITGGACPRARVYAEGLIFAFSPWLCPKKFHKECFKKTVTVPPPNPNAQEVESASAQASPITVSRVSAVSAVSASAI